jgi:integrase
VARGDVAVNPTTGLELPAVRGRRDRIVSPEQAAKLLEALPERDRAMWATALYGGLRRGELQALRWEDVDLAKGVRQCCATTSSSTSSARTAADTSSRA